jgi:hypothetical protein
MPRATIEIVLETSFPATTRTRDDRIPFARTPEILSLSMLEPVLRVALNDLQILRPIVGFVAIDVVNQLASLQPPPEFSLHHEAMLVSDTTTGEMMGGGNRHDNIAV